MADTPKYDAFISYRHLDFDKKVAIKLQKQLESYKPPKQVLGGEEFRHFRVFRDETELSTSNSLTDSIRAALENTRYLIVVCSSGTAQSRWCLEEITYFKELHGGSTSHIRVIVIEGDPTKIIPQELLTEERSTTDADGNTVTETVPVEPLALNIVAPTQQKSLKKLNVEYIRIAATLLEHDFEDLYQRNQRRVLRRTVTIGTAAGALLLGIIIYGGIMLVYANRQRDLAQENYAIAEEQKTLAQDNLEQARSLLVSNALDYAMQLNGIGARTRSAALLKELHGQMGSDWDNRDELEAKFRSAAMGALHYNKDSIYASLDFGEPILDITLAEDGGTAYITTDHTVSLVDTATGKISHQITAPGQDVFASSAVRGNTILGGLYSGDALLFDISTGTQTVYEKLCPSPIERVAFLQDGQTLAFLHTSLRTEDYKEEISLTIIPFREGGEEPLATAEKQTFTQDSDLRGDVVVRYSYSQNGRFLAVKDNTVVSVVGGNKFYDIPSRDISVLDTSLFDAGKSQAENLAAMQTVVDAGFGLEDGYITARYHVDNAGVLYVDTQTVLYDGTRELGYILGYSFEDKRQLQQIGVYDVPGKQLLFLDSLLEGGSLMFSSFVPLNDSYNHLAYVRHTEDEDETLFLSYSLLGEPDLERPAVSQALGENSYGETGTCVALPQKYEDWTPSYLYSIDTPGGANKVFRVSAADSVEFPTGMGSCGAVDANKERSLYVTGYKSGTMHLYSLVASHQPAPQTGQDTYHYFFGDLYKGAEVLDVSIEHVATLSTFRFVAYNEDRTQMLGHVKPAEGESGESGYFIWDMATGKALQKLEFLPDDSTLASSIAITPDFSTVALCKKVYKPRFASTYTLYDMETGGELGAHSTLSDYAYFGFGQSKNQLWVLQKETGTLEVLNMDTGELAGRRYIKHTAIPSYSSRVFYNPQLDYIILNDSIYSFLYEQVIFEYDSIASASSDCTKIYLTKTGACIDLSFGALAAQLAEDPAIPAAFEEDRAATGIDVLA